MIRPGEEIVLVLTASAHRQAAFEAAAFLMDYLKTRAPFWKREHLDGRHERRLGRGEGYGRPGGGKVEPIALDAVARRDEHYL